MFRMSRVSLAAFALVPLLVAFVSTPVTAQDHGGGSVATNGKVVKFDLESWIPGTTTNLQFTDAPATTISYILAFSVSLTSTSIPGFNGTLRADVTAGRGFYLFGQATTPVALPANAGGKVIIQGAVIDRNGQGYFTDATTVDLFNPTVMVGNSRQSANSINVIDLPTRKSVQRLANSELGHITFSFDRKWAYVTEPGSQRNRVVPYDLTGSTIQAKTPIALTGGVRYRCAATKDGKRLYVPVHDGVDVIDTDPTSSTFHKQILKITVPITGTSGAIFTGPMGLALGFNDTRLYIAYGEQLTYPAKSTVGVIDLNKTGTPHRAIPVTTGGSFIGIATRMDIVPSADGLHVFVLEWGVQPIPNFTLGYANGGMLNVVSTILDRETAAIPTGGFGGQELCADRLGRNVWTTHVDQNNFGELLRIDVDRRSQNQFSIKSRIKISNATYAASSSGPMGICTTPDSSTVCFTVVEGTGQAFPEMWTLNARTEKLFGTPVRVESLPGTLSITQF